MSNPLFDLMESRKQFLADRLEFEFAVARVFPKHTVVVRGTGIWGLVHCPVAGFPERLGILHENGNVWDVDIVKLKPVVDSRCWPEWTKRLHAKLMDDLRHAPLCPANHYHGSRTPTGQCSCGAVAVTESDV